MLKRTFLIALAVLPLVAVGVAAPAEAGWRYDQYGYAYHDVPRGPGYWTRDQYGQSYYKRTYGVYGGGWGYPRHHWHPYGYGGDYSYGYGGY